MSCLSGCTLRLRTTIVSSAFLSLCFVLFRSTLLTSRLCTLFGFPAKGIEVELITEAGESYAEATPAVESEPDLHSSFNLELTAVASSPYGVAKAPDYYGSLQNSLLHDADDDATTPHADHSVTAAKILPALLRCGVGEHTCSVFVFVLSAVIAVATLAMQALNPTSVAAS